MCGAHPYIYASELQSEMMAGLTEWLLQTGDVTPVHTDARVRAHRRPRMRGGAGGTHARGRPLRPSPPPRAVPCTQEAFQNCKSLKSVKMGSSVKSIGVVRIAAAELRTARVDTSPAHARAAHSRLGFDVVLCYGTKCASLHIRVSMQASTYCK